MSLVLQNASGSRATGTSLLVGGKSFNFITQSMRKKFLESFERDLDSNPLYIFYGRAKTWDSPNDTLGYDSPTKPSNKIADDISTRSDIVAGQRINAADTRAAFRKITWKAKSVYNQYDVSVDQTLSPNNNFYVVQDDPSVVNYGAVYKCLDNNNGGQSLYRPFQYIDPEINPKVLPDGYKWKYMFTIPGADLSRFNTNQSPRPDFVPIITDLTYKTAPGTIDRIDIDSPGVNYKPIIGSDNLYYGAYNTPVTPIFIEGDGDDVRSASVVIETTKTDGAISSLRGVDEGPGGIDYGTRQDRYSVLTDSKLNGYVPIALKEELGDLTTETINAINTTGRKTAYGIAKINSVGKVESPGDIIIINGGTGYQESSRVRVVQSSTIAFGTEYNSTNGVSKIKIEQPGANHTTANVVPISSTTENAGFKGTSILAPLSGHGGNPKLELNSQSLFVNTRIQSTNSSGNVTIDLDFPSVNDFRQVGLLQNARKFNSASPSDFATDKTVSAKYIMEVEDNSTGSLESIRDSAINDDMIITGNISGARGRVVDIFDKVTGGSLKQIRFTQLGRTSFNVGENILFAGVSGNNIQIKSIQTPDVDVYSGDILFINNNNRINRNKKQTETVNFLIQF